MNGTATQLLQNTLIMDYCRFNKSGTEVIQKEGSELYRHDTKNTVKLQGKRFSAGSVQVH